MKHVLITAFEPYDQWSRNASWLALVEMTKDLPPEPKVTTRLYPVEYEAMRERLETDLADDYDVAIHLGQAPGSTCIQLEAVALNLAHYPNSDPEHRPLLSDAPLAYSSSLPLGKFATNLRSAGMPVQVSHHAGTYLCNAVFYLSRHLAETRSLKTESVFIHLPLDLRQTVGMQPPMPSLPCSTSADALKLVLAEISATI